MAKRRKTQFANKTTPFYRYLFDISALTIFYQTLIDEFSKESFMGTGHVLAATLTESKLSDMSDYRPLKEQYYANTGDEYQSMAFHPRNVLLILIITSLSILFLSLSIAFVYTRFQQGLSPIRLPNIFLFNTLILVVSSYMLISAKKAYQQDNTARYQQLLIATLSFSILFLGLQIIGWTQLFRQEVLLHSDTASGYLYAISGLHFLHVIGGIPFLAYFIHQAFTKMREPASVLVYFSDPEKRLQLRLLSIYWHFLDALWIYLILFFFINYLII